MEQSLLRTKEELQSVRTPSNSAPPGGSSSSSSSSSDSESDHEHSEENSTYSAELHSQDISEDHLEEERLTEAEKNQRLRKQLMVRTRPRSSRPLLLQMNLFHSARRGDLVHETPVELVRS